MSLISIVRDYIGRMLQDISGMKVLVLDSETEVVIFIVGGTTYEEARTVALHNSTNSGTRFILGGSAILNSKRFLKDLEEAQRISRSSNSI